jgi:site-specific recombinase XerC
MSDAFDRHLDKFLDYLNVERHVSPYTARNYSSDLQALFAFLRSRNFTSPLDVDKYSFQIQYSSQAVGHSLLLSLP